MNIELLAAFIADETLPALAEISGARELRALEQGWRAIDRAQITRDIEQAIGVARRRFVESIKSRGIKTDFNVIGGTEAIASLLRAGDIVAIIEPAHPGERITCQFTALLEAAFAVAGAVLLVPRRVVRTAGPIVTVASTSEDPGIRAAEQLGVQIEYVAGREPLADVSWLADAAACRSICALLAAAH